MVMAQDPELLLVDEPVAGMTDEETARTGELLLSIAAERSVLVIEHDMEFVRQIARTVTVLHQGTRAVRGPGRAGAERPAGARGLPRAQARRTSRMLSVEKLDVAYGGSQVLWGVDLKVPAGEVVCLMGRNGVGKTTCSRRSWACCRPAAGASCSTASDITAGRPTAGRAPGIGYVPQGREIFPHLTRARRTSGWRCSAASRAASIDDALDALSRAQAAARRARAACCRAASSRAGHRPRAAHRAQALMLDEPTEGIQPSIILEIEEAIRRIKTRAGAGRAARRAVPGLRRAAGRQLRDHGQGRRRGRRAPPKTSRLRDVVKRHLRRREHSQRGRRCTSPRASRRSC